MQVEERKNKIIAIIATLLTSVLVIVILCVTSLYYEWPPKDQPEIEESEILYGGEFVEFGDVETPAYEEPAPPVTPEEPTPSEETAQPEKLIASEQESPMKVERDKKEEEAKERKEEQKRKKAEAQQREREKIDSRLAGKFGNKGGGKQGRVDGNADRGSIGGQPGADLGGRTLASWGRPVSHVEGEVVIRVKVDPKGKVIEAKYKSGKGKANGSTSVRESCIKASLKSKFSVAKNRTTNQTGTIIWKFK